MEQNILRELPADTTAAELPTLPELLGAADGDDIDFDPGRLVTLARTPHL